MIMGRIPNYLNLLQSRLSCSQKIDAYFFNGILWDEFEHLYRTLFTNSKSHIKAVEALSRKTGGPTRNERIKITKIPANGSG